MMSRWRNSNNPPILKRIELYKFALYQWGMTLTRQLLLSLMALALPLFVQAAEKKPADKPPVTIIQQAPCPPTAVIPTRNYPGSDAIPTINSLAKPAGKAVVAEGQQVHIIGRVVDAACTPILDAKVELWQNDPYGRWILANDSDLVNPKPVFTGAGRTYTGSNGEFHFITLFPAPTGNRAPNFNIKIKAPDLLDFSTTLYFAGDARNMMDPMFNRLSPMGQQTLSIDVAEASDAMQLALVL